MKTNSSILVILVLVSFLTGCARQRFSYPVPGAGEAKSDGPTLTVDSVRDVRTNRRIDRVFVTNYLSEIQAALVADLQSTRKFRSVSRAGESNGTGGEFSLKADLRDLQWEVPGYNGKVVTIGVLSLFTGAIGAFIYGSTSTDVNGTAVVRFELRSAGAGGPAGGVLLEREFTGRHRERTSILSCDTYSTQARVTALAFRDAVAQCKVELERALGMSRQAWRRNELNLFAMHGGTRLMERRREAGLESRAGERRR